MDATNNNLQLVPSAIVKNNPLPGNGLGRCPLVLLPLSSFFSTFSVSFPLNRFGKPSCKHRP